MQVDSGTGASELGKSVVVLVVGSIIFNDFLTLMYRGR